MGLGIIIGTAIGIIIGTLFWFVVVIITLKQKTNLQNDSDELVAISKKNNILLEERNEIGRDQSTALWGISSKLT